MNLNLTDQQLQSVVGLAIVNTVTDETRKSILVQAVENILKPGGGGYYDKQKSPLLGAFENAIQMYAHQYIKDRLKNDEQFKGIVDGLLKSALEKVFIDQDKIAEKMASAIKNYLISDRERD